MYTIEFSHNWNGKLFLDNFGTVRLHNPEKYKPGNEMDAKLKNIYLGSVQVVAVRTFEYKYIRDVLSYLDTGKPAHYMAEVIRRMYQQQVVFNANTKLDHVVFHYIKRNLQTQSELLAEWWREKELQNNKLY